MAKAPKGLGGYLDAYADAFHAAAGCPRDHYGKGILVGEANRARARLVQAIKRHGYTAGVKAAAEFIEQWTGQPQKHRLGDVILYKFNLTQRKPRLARTKRRNAQGAGNEADRG